MFETNKSLHQVRIFRQVCERNRQQTERVSIKININVICNMYILYLFRNTAFPIIITIAKQMANGHHSSLYACVCVVRVFSSI